MARALSGFNPYAYNVLGRGYGKLKETRSTEPSGKITLEQASEAARRAEEQLNGDSSDS